MGAATPDLEKGVEATVQESRPGRPAGAALHSTAPTGLADVDRFLAGGMPRGATCLISGPRFAGKWALAHRFLAEGIRLGEPTLALLTDGAVAEWKAAIGRYVDAADMDDPRTIRFIDFFPVPGATPPANVQSVPGQDDAAAIADACHAAVRAASRRPGRFVFDSLSTLVRLHGMERVLRVLPPLAAAIRATGSTGLVLLEEGVLSDPDVRLLLRHMDGRIRLQQTESGRSLRIEGLGRDASPWIPFRVEDGFMRTTYSWGAGRIT